MNVYAGSLVADGPTGCVGRCSCGWRSEHSRDNGPAFKALLAHMESGQHELEVTAAPGKGPTGSTGIGSLAPEPSSVSIGETEYTES